MMFKNLIRRVRPAPPETPYQEVQRLFANLQCPVCESQALFDGPRGGASVNVMCFACGSRFNTFGSTVTEFTHGPQPDLWDQNREVTMFPDVERVERVKEALSR